MLTVSSVKHRIEAATLKTAILSGATAREIVPNTRIMSIKVEKTGEKPNSSVSRFLNIIKEESENPIVEVKFRTKVNPPSQPNP